MVTIILIATRGTKVKIIFSFSCKSTKTIAQVWHPFVGHGDRLLQILKNPKTFRV